MTVLRNFFSISYYYVTCKQFHLILSRILRRYEILRGQIHFLSVRAGMMIDQRIHFLIIQIICIVMRVFFGSEGGSIFVDRRNGYSCLTLSKGRVGILVVQQIVFLRLQLSLWAASGILFIRDVLL